MRIFHVDRGHDRTGRDECNTDSRCEDILTVWLPVQTWSLVRCGEGTRELGEKFFTINGKDDVSSDDIGNTLTKGKVEKTRNPRTCLLPNQFVNELEREIAVGCMWCVGL